MSESRHALLIASSVYLDPELHPLNGPQSDVKDLQRVLEDPAIGDFTVRRLTNPTAARAARAVEEFFQDRRQEDTLLLFFSGHGLKSDRNEIFFAMHDTHKRRLRSSTLSGSFVRDVMAASKSQRQMVLLDCCYGGTFARGLAKGDDQVDVVSALEGYGTVVLTASTATEFAWQEGPVDGLPQRSVFTGIIVDGLRTGAADVDGDGMVTVHDLHRFASQRVRALGSAQTPTISGQGQEGDLVIGRVEHWSPPAPREAAPAMVSARAGVVDLAAHVTIHNGGDEGSSVGQAVACAVETCLSLAGRPTLLSSRYAYLKAQILDGRRPTEAPGDVGATIKAGIDVVRLFGLPLESVWPYVPRQFALPDGMTWEELDTCQPRFRAAFHPISRYEEVPYHLLSRRPILVGFSVFRSWYSEETQRTGWITVDEDADFLGGHAIVIVGFDGDRNALKFANSWGTDWGDGGFGYIPQAAVEQALSNQDAGVHFWALELSDDEPPARTRKPRQRR